MAINYSVPWHRYGVIVELAEQLEGYSSQFGKTSLMKFVYLLQELKGVNMGYQYSLYTYGPFTAEVLGDLDYTEFIGGVDVEYLGDENGGYAITSGDEADDIRERAKDELSQWRKDIEELVLEFGGLKSRDLELISTTIYAYRDAKNDEDDIKKEDLIGRVQRIKPKFDRTKINTEIEGLIEREYIAVAG